MKKLDLVGHRYNRLTILSFSHKTASKRNHYLCRCDCGNETVVDVSNLRSGSTKSCGCARAGINTKHGKTNSKVYKSWCKIKERCYNKNCKDYADYGAKGIFMDEEFKTSFESFYKEVGDPPENTPNWTIDRISNNIGYLKGNIKWATRATQNRNNVLQKNNSSGYCGVHWVYNRGKTRVLASWSDFVTGRPRGKTFSVSTYGLLPAFAMAVEFRNNIIKEMNEQGADYSVNHGQPFTKGH